MVAGCLLGDAADTKPAPTPIVTNASIKKRDLDTSRRLACIASPSRDIVRNNVVQLFPP
jgi:hypothetical protein